MDLPRGEKYTTLPPFPRVQALVPKQAPTDDWNKRYRFQQSLQVPSTTKATLTIGAINYAQVYVNDVLVGVGKRTPRTFPITLPQGMSHVYVDALQTDAVAGIVLSAHVPSKTM